ncbi:hypothetical protein QJS10_CPA08g00482 [Acorus calamus]|uniref:Uncharacterized protein n=1 Tax=Acorus calamus TaxID=4465 RepID=A0AAV9EDJ6_ACOCL|nr:hypothetical protein QJS10_CPA08g00482 [Acorus calamus]
MSRISMMGLLQSGQEPRLSQSSREQTLQNVCPHGMNAAPFLLPIQTQHHPPPPSPRPSSAAASPPTSPSSRSLISETLFGVPKTTSSDSRKWRSASSAAARFIIAGASSAAICLSVSGCGADESCSSSSSMRSTRLEFQELPQQPIMAALNLSRLFRSLHFPPLSILL